MNAMKQIALLTTAALLAACSQPMGTAGNGYSQGGNSINKQDVGLLAGAIGGGVIGHNIGKGSGQTVATIAGTLLGAGLGSSIGSSLDKADMAVYHDTSQRALETAQPGQTLPWKNPQTGNYGSVTPSNVYQNAQGDYCREYSQTIVVGGKSQQGFGKACRQPDGAWQIVQ